MKRSKRFIFALLAMICIFPAMFPLTGFAAERTYKARFYASNADIGAINGASVQISDKNGFVTSPGIRLLNDKYYVKGFKESGKDPDSFFPAGGTIPISEDRDYVAVFGVRGEEVKYKVRYVLYGTNTQLADEAEFNAQKGDRPISSYIYIDGYEPYRRTTKTIIGDEAEDILYCYYTRIPAPTTTTTVVPGAPAPAGAAAAAANAANNPANPNANNQQQQGANNPTENANLPTQQYAQTEDILDLDVPLAEFGGATGSPAVPNAPKVIEPNTHGRLPSWALVLSAVVLLGLIAMLYWYLLFYRKKKKYASADNDIDFGDYEEDDDY